MVEGFGREGLNAAASERTAAVILDYIEGLPPLPVAIRQIALFEVPERSDRPGRSGRPVWPGFDGDLIAKRLGEQVVGAAAVAWFVNELFGDKTGAGVGRVDPVAFWRHGIKVAAICEGLNDEVKRRHDPGILFAAALLHDVGKWVLGRCMPKAYARIIRYSDLHRVALHRVERSQLGVDHARAGVHLLKHWSLPDAIQDAIGWHHRRPGVTADAASFTELAATIGVANELAGRGRLGYPGRADPTTLESLCAGIGVTMEAVDAIAERSGERADGLWIVLRPMLRMERPGSREKRARGPAGLGTAGGRHRAETSPHIGRCFRALTGFVKAASPDDRSPALCGRIVDCVIESLGIDTAVAFSVNPIRTLYQCAARCKGKTVSAIVAVRPEDVPPTDQIGPIVRSDDPASGRNREPEPVDPLPPLVTVPAVALPVRERFGDIFTSDQQVMLPLTQGRNFLGGVLMDVQVATSAGLESLTDVLELLAATFAGALAWAASLIEAERRNEALADMNERLHDAQQEAARTRSLSMIAKLAAGAAHELNTPLAVISGRAQILARQATAPDQRRLLESLYDQSHKCSRIVSELVAFAKPTPPQPELIALPSWLSQLRQRWAWAFVDTAGGFFISLIDETITVWADPEHLVTVFDALLSNAVDAMKSENARLVINSASCSSDETVVIAVDDNGGGMSREVLEHACDPFYSHRTAGRGRGLGLSIAQRLVEINGGRLWIESAPGIGSRVFVELPIRAGPR